MALEIRRTPVLYGDDAKHFLKEIETIKPSKLTRKEILTSMEQAKILLEQLRTNDR
jgi:hypothetical protein